MSAQAAPAAARDMAERARRKLREVVTAWRGLLPGGQPIPVGAAVEAVAPVLALLDGALAPATPAPAPSDPARGDLVMSRVLFEVEPRDGRWMISRITEGASGSVKRKAFGPYGSQREAEGVASQMRADRDWREAGALIGVTLHHDSSGALHRLAVADAADVRVERHMGGVRVTVQRDGCTWHGDFEVRPSSRGQAER